MKLLGFSSDATEPGVWADVFYFPAAQNSRQRVQYVNDQMEVAGAVGGFPGLGDESPPRVIQVDATFRLGWGETVNGTTIASWVQLFEARDSLMAAIDGQQGLLIAERPDGEILNAWAKTQSVEVVSDPKLRRLIEISARFILPEAIWYSLTRVGGWNLDDGYYLNDGLYLDSSASFNDLATGDNFTIIYEGNVNAHVMGILVSTHSGTVTNPKITNNTTGDWFQWTGTLSTNTLSVYPAERNIYRTGSSDEYDNFSMGSTQFDWMKLKKNTANEFTFTCSGGGTARVSFVLWRQYRNA